MNFRRVTCLVANNGKFAGLMAADSVLTEYTKTCLALVARQMFQRHIKLGRQDDEDVKFLIRREKKDKCGDRRGTTFLAEVTYPNGAWANATLFVDKEFLLSPEEPYGLVWVEYEPDYLCDAENN